MDFKQWIENVEGWASVYAFDLMPDGSFGEIKLMAFNSQNLFMMNLPPEAPKFYPGIPYRTYFTDLNFESYVYKSASTHEPLYSYVNARGGWLKGLYLPITEAGTVSAQVVGEMDKSRTNTLYCLYVAIFSPDVNTDSMTGHDPEVANAVIDIGIKLHEKKEFHQTIASAAGEIKKSCGAEKCAVYIVDKVTGKCEFVDENGVQHDYLEQFSREMELSPFEIAMRWEQDLALSDCLILDDLSVIKERDPEWYRSLSDHNISRVILYAIRFNNDLLGFVWVTGHNESELVKIKEIMELASYTLGAVIENHQLFSRLEEKSSTDGLTQVLNRNAMNDRVDKLASGEDKLPETLGIAFADLNGLKTVNDELGHNAGDKLLTRAAALLKLAFTDGEIYRAGGDEFVIFCPNITQDELDRQVTQLMALADSASDVSFAVGTEFCTGDYGVRAAMQKADENMYKNKEEYYRLNPQKKRRRH